MLSCFGTKSKTKNIIFFGLEDAGKSSILYRLKYDAFIPVQPTIGYNCEVIPREFAGKNSKVLNLRCLDLPGAKHLRLVWSQFMSEEIDGLIFVIDMGIYVESPEYASKCKQVLWETLDQFELLDTTPLLVYLNKTDLNQPLNNPGGDNNRTKNQRNYNSMKAKTDPETVREIFQSLALPQLKNRSYQICPCSAVTGDGLQQGLSWLTRVTLSKTECRDKTVVKNYNMRHNGSKLGHLVTNMTSRTSLKEALNSQLPLSASISRIRKHIPYNPLEDEYLIEKNRRKVEVQEPVAPEQISLEEVKSPPSASSRKPSTVAELQKRVNSEMRKSQPEWRDKIDKRYNELNSSMTEIRNENQEKRKRRVSDISAIAGKDPPRRGRSPNGSRRSYLRRSASNPLSDKRKNQQNSQNLRNITRNNSTSRSMNKSHIGSERYTNRSQTRNSVIFKNQKTWHPNNESSSIVPPAEPSECSNFYQSRKNVYKYISQNAKETTPLKLDQISNISGPLQLRYSHIENRDENISKFSNKNPTEILRRRHQRTVEYSTPNLLLESFDTKKSDSFRFQSNIFNSNLESSKNDISRAAVNHSTPLDKDDDEVFSEISNDNGYGDTTPLTSKKRNSVAGSSKPTKMFLKYNKNSFSNSRESESENIENLSPIEAEYLLRPGSIGNNNNSKNSYHSQYKMTSFHSSTDPNEQMLPKNDENPTHNLCTSSSEQSLIEVPKVFQRSPKKKNSKISSLSNEIHEVASTCNSTMEGSYLLNSNKPNPSNNFLSSKKSQSSFYKKQLDRKLESRNKDRFDFEDEEKQRAKDFRKEQFHKRFREIFSSDCESDCC